MSKQRRPPSQEQVAPEARGERSAPSADTELAGQVGNQALQALLGGAVDAPATGTEPQVAARELAGRAALALSVAPRDPSWSERLVDLVRRSGLPPERRDAIVDRLSSDQAVADEVAAAVRSWLGADSESARSDLIAAIGELSRMVDPPAGEAAFAAAVSDRLGPEGPAPEAVEGLVRQLALMVHLVWDEEEEQGPPGDYASEESGF